MREVHCVLDLGGHVDDEFERFCDEVLRQLNASKLGGHVVLLSVQCMIIILPYFICRSTSTFFEIHEHFT